MSLVLAGYSGFALADEGAAHQELELDAPRMMRAEASRHLGAAIDMAGHVQSIELTASRSADDVDCVWSDWVDWSVCQFTCGGGESIRTRKVKVMAQGDGKSCDGNAKENRDCTKNDCPIDCLWADWSKYSACSSTCGPGVKSRTRGYRQVAEFGGAECVGNGTQISECNKGDCPVDCVYADWDPWGGCSKSCGGGTRKRFRSVAAEPSADGKLCEDVGSESEETPCGQNACPVDCVLTDWGLWDLCDVSCGTGSTKRTRSVKVFASYGGLACEGLSENKTCDNGVCPVDCELSDWSEWSPCDRSCKTDTEPGERKRYRTVMEEGNEFGKPCPDNQTSHVQTGICSLHQCPSDCKLSDWTGWSDCSVSCGRGIAERWRQVEVAATFGGKECHGNGGNLTYEKKYCSVDTCPVDCEWNDWQDWRGCSTSCGPGTGIRMRDVKTPMLHGGKDCDGGFSQERECNLKFCPLHCTLADWSDWAGCSASCGDGSETRERQVSVKADFGGLACTGDTQASRSCSVKACPIHCQWQDWSDWNECTSSCGSGQQARTRSVAVQPMYGGDLCEGFASDTRPCESLPICPTDCEWDVWTDWEGCSVTCGAGVSRRTRMRKKYEKDGGHVCWGTEDDEQVCTLDACPVDCTLGDWSEWAPCTVTCGKGSQTRLRGIRLGPASGGKGCDPKLNETKTCDLGICPVDCQWSLWEAWSTCSRSCNGGSYTRHRFEKVAAAHGGQACSGSADEDGVCNAQGCPVDCQWVPWSDWSGCSASCGGGTRSQSRVVEVTPQWGGLECETHNELGGPATEKTETCNEHPCPVDCQWSSWSKFSLCSKTCEAGTMSRTRTRTPEEANGGKPCTGDVEESNFCNTQGCPRDCQWNEWTPWTPCSKLCGGGKIKRFRDIAIPRKNGGEPCAGQGEQEADCNVMECAVQCEWDEWTDWSACPVTCDGGIRTKSRNRKHEEHNGGIPCAGNSTEREFCNSDPCPVDCAFGLWEDWGECSTSCGVGQRFRTRVKSAELYGGRPCEEAMIQTGECGTANETPGCPILATSSTTVALPSTTGEWGSASGAPYYPDLHGQQHEIPHPDDLLKNFSIVKDPQGIPTVTSTTTSTSTSQPVPCTKDEIKAALDKYDDSTVKNNLNEVIRDLTGRKPEEREVPRSEARAAAEKALSRLLPPATGQETEASQAVTSEAMRALSTNPKKAEVVQAVMNASLSPDTTTLSETLAILKALPYKTHEIEMLVANITEQLAASLPANMTAEQVMQASPQQLDNYLVEKAMKASGSLPSEEAELVRNMSATAAAAPMTESSKNFTVPFFTNEDGKQVLAEIGGDLSLDVTDADKFASNAAVTVAMRKAIAALAGLSDDSAVKVDITIPQAILLATWRRKVSGNVNVAYLIEVLQSSTLSAASIAEKISKQDINTVTGEIRKFLTAADLTYTLRATSLSVTILPVSDLDSAQAAMQKIATASTAAAVNPHSNSIQDAAVSEANAGEVQATPDSPVIETAQQAAQATVSMAVADSKQSTAADEDDGDESDLPQGSEKSFATWCRHMSLSVLVFTTGLLPRELL